MIAPTLTERAFRDAFSEAGRAPVGIAGQDKLAKLTAATHARLVALPEHVSPTRLQEAVARLLSADDRNWPGVEGIVRELGLDTRPAAERLDDAPTSPSCTLECRRGLLDWYDREGYAWLTACVCVAGRWIRARPELRVSGTDPTECRNRGWVRGHDIYPRDPAAPESGGLAPGDARLRHVRASGPRLDPSAVAEVHARTAGRPGATRAAVYEVAAEIAAMPPPVLGEDRYHEDPRERR